MGSKRVLLGRLSIRGQMMIIVLIALLGLMAVGGVAFVGNRIQAEHQAAADRQTKIYQLVQQIRYAFQDAPSSKRTS